MLDAQSASSLKEAELSYEQNLSQINKFKKIRSIVTVSLFVVILAFVGFVYSKLTSLADVEKLAPSVQKELSYLTPEVYDIASQVIQEAAPVYMAAVQDKLGSMDSRFQQEVIKQKQRLEVSLANMVQNNFLQTVDSVSEYQFNRISRKIPELRTPQGRVAVYDKVRESIEGELSVVLSPIVDKLVGDIHAISEIVQDFDSTKYENYSRSELRKYFVHLWIILLDQYVMDPQSFNMV